MVIILVCLTSKEAIIWANSSKGPRKLHGRFLHITDMHPDPYYTPRTSLSTSCHRKKSKKKKNKSFYFGTPYSWVILSHLLLIEYSHLLDPFSECDSPLRLTNLTLDFLNDDWAPEIDFVICSSFLLSLNQAFSI